MMEPAQFFARLNSLAEHDSAVVAALRRSLAFDPGSFAGAYPLVEPCTTGMQDRRRQCYYLAAGLWGLAARRTSGPPMTLEAALRQIATRSSSVTLRFMALLDSEDDELPHRLRQAVSLVAAEQIALDWPRLLSDLLGWNAEARHVQRRWARVFWSAAEHGPTILLPGASGESASMQP